jgi:hypothetical protein
MLRSLMTITAVVATPIASVAQTPGTDPLASGTGLRRWGKATWMRSP